VLYFAIPTFDEAETIGLLLWRLRTVMATQGAEYEVLVYDDGSRDATREVLAPYERVLPLTVLTGTARRGTGAALDQLAREATRRTRYPRRDALVFLQGDLTDRPEDLPELLRRFGAGADLVVGERTAQQLPMPLARVRRAERWFVKRLVRIDGLSDFTSAMRVVRLGVVREALATRGPRGLADGTGPTAQLDALLALLPHARRMDVVPVEPRFDLRSRASRLRGWPDALALVKYAWAHRGAHGISVQRADVRKPATAPEDEGEELSPSRRRHLEDDIEHAPTAPTGSGRAPERRRDRDSAPPRTSASERRERPRRERVASESVSGRAAEGEPELARTTDESSEPSARRGRKRRRKRGERREVDGAVAGADLDADGTAEAGVIEQSTSDPDGGRVEAGEGETTDERRARKRRRRRKGARRTAEVGGAGVTPVDSADDSGEREEPAGSDGDAEEVGDATESAEERAVRRRRRARRRRRGGSGRVAAGGDDGAPGSEASEGGADGAADGADTDTDGPLGDDEGAPDGPRARRRGRRRRRRGSRREEGGAPEGGTDTPAPAAE
jgi:hypothetical protein